MSYWTRICIRIGEEGIIKTIYYVFYAAFYCFRELLLELYYDLRYSREYLKGNCRTVYKHLGANDVYHTKYSVMPLIFHFVKIKSSDVLVDVGCGKGRIINYWLSLKRPNKLVGLELDSKVARCTARHFARYNKVEIKAGDAINNLPKDGTVFYFYNPFCPEKVIEFEAALATKYQNAQIKIIYYNPKSINVFQNDRWHIRYINFEKDLGLKRWGRINKYHDLAIITSIH